MRNLKLRQALQLLVIIMIVFTSVNIGKAVYNQITELTGDYQSIDPYQSESPNLRVPGGYLTIQENVMENSPQEARKLAVRASVINNLNGILHLTLRLLILLSILPLIRTWDFHHFFVPENYRGFRRISYFYLGWIICHFMLLMSISILFSYDTITHYYNVAAIHLHEYGSPWIKFKFTLASISRTLERSIDFSALFVFFLMFILSITLREGIKLQEQADLTI